MELLEKTIDMEYLKHYDFSNTKNVLESYYQNIFQTLTNKEISFLHEIITFGKIEIINRSIYSDNISKNAELMKKYRTILKKCLLPIDIIVWRGGPPFGKFEIGNEYVSPFFMSTSLDPLVAISYMSRSGKDYLYQFKLSKETPAIYFGDFLPKANNEDSEISLIDNIKFKILDIQNMKFKKFQIITAEAS